MPSIAEVLLTKFAEDAEHATTIKSKIIAERNLAVASCVVALEQNRPDISPEIYSRNLEDIGVVATGAINTEDWRTSMRIITANIYPEADCMDDEQILITLGDGNPYLDLCKASHPASDMSGYVSRAVA